MNTEQIINEVLKTSKVISTTKDVNTILHEIDSLRNRIVEKDLGNLEIENLLNGRTNKYGISFESGFGTSSDPDLAQLGIINAYTADTGFIVIVYNDNFWESFDKQDNSIWKTFLTSLKNLVSHELVHREQISRMRSKTKDSYKFQQILKKLQEVPDESDKYLSNPQELMAFANEAVEQFRNLGYTDKQILNKIKQPFNESINPGRGESHIFWTYTEMYGSGDKTLRKFLNYMVQYL